MWSVSKVILSYARITKLLKAKPTVPKQTYTNNSCCAKEESSVLHA